MQCIHQQTCFKNNFFIITPPHSQTLKTVYPYLNLTFDLPFLLLLQVPSQYNTYKSHNIFCYVKSSVSHLIQLTSGETYFIPSVSSNISYQGKSSERQKNLSKKTASPRLLRCSKRVRFPMRSLDLFLIDLILPAGLRPQSRLSF